MAVSEARKKANDKWDKANMAYVTCKVKKEQAEQFRDYCERIGKTPNAVIKEYVISCIKQEVEL